MPAYALATAVSIASLNLCADEYLLLLGKPGEIASVTHLSKDRLESPHWAMARPYPANRGSIEDVVGEKPTHFLTMGGSGRSTTLIARRLGIRSVDLRPNVGLADVEANLRTVAGLLGDERRARPWIAAIRKLQAERPKRLVDTLWISGGGQTFAPGSAGPQWLALAGLGQRPVRGGRVTLETLLIRPPSVIVQSRYRSAQMSLGQRWLDHPIVRGASSRRLVTDGRRWTCMGPLLIGEIRRLKSDLQ